MKKLSEPNPKSMLIFSDEDCDEIKRMAALHLDLKSMAIRLGVDPERFTGEYHRPGSMVRRLIDVAETDVDIEQKQQIADRIKDPNDYEAARQSRADSKQARWDRYKTRLLFDKKVDEYEALHMAIEHGNGKLSAEKMAHFEKLDFIRSLYTQMNSRNYIVSAVRIKWPEVTWSVARNLYYESINFFNSDTKVSKEVWGNVYADQLDVIASMAFETGQFDVAGKYKLEAARLRGVGRDEPAAIPEELLDRRPVLYTIRPKDVGIDQVNRNELAKFIDQLDVSSKEKRKVRRDAMIDGLNFDELLKDGDEDDSEVELSDLST
jgi:hypothetical protein